VLHQIADLLNTMRLMAHRKKQREALDCIVLTGSYDPVARTISAQEMVSAVELDQDGNLVDTPVVYQNVPIAGDWSSEYGPRGGERCTLIPVEGGAWRAIFDKEEDDSLQTPSGEWWLSHKDANGNVDAYVKLTNDGPNQGDALAAINALAGALLRVATAGGLILRADDSLGYMEVGDEGLDADLDAAATKRYVQQYVTDVFNEHTHSGVQAGGADTAPPNQTMDFTGSALVKIAQ
jgi:hypothetical protein